MKISFLVDTINEKSGARAPLKIAEGLALLGERVTVFAYEQNRDEEVQKNLEAKGLEIKFISKNISRLGKYPTAVSLIKPLTEGKFALISCHSSFPFFYAAKWAQTPIIYTYYGTQLVDYDLAMAKEIGLTIPLLTKIRLKAADQVILLLERNRLRFSDRIVGLSKSTQEECQRLYGVASDYIYLGADLDYSRQLKRDRKELKKKDEILLLTVSRITPYKGFHRVLAAFENLKDQYPQARLVMIGSSYQANYLDYLKTQLSDRMEIILKPDDGLLQQYYQECDVYLSGTSWEGFGLPFLEAQYQGKPALGFNNTSIPEVVADGQTGYVVNSQEEFQEKLEKLLSSKDLRTKLGSQARTFAARFTWAKTAQEYQQYFADYLGGSKP